MYLALQTVVLVDSCKMGSSLAGMQKCQSGRMQPMHADLINSMELHPVSVLQLVRRPHDLDATSAA